MLPRPPTPHSRKAPPVPDACEDPDHGQLHANSSTVNTGDVNGTAYVQTPEAGNLTDPSRPCLWFSVAFYTIRWDDNTLSSGRVLVAQGDWVNPICQVTPASDLRAR